ncbi:MAG: hydrogenase expression/formation protein HypE [Candidatus Coatesbacteria bacterium RBG_13_66_14]|uniref:Hydrogenase expression/formation protein HypE n=1 Tax=Candidatus Coatesbacteria bacterium RBG_13_66_14 TaxID=1817816 RepID=A0A1F5FB07_9BACT|nr:MAG: hydrogenase expression/formation protein HypE [Candidatus Coatesbacteria bacterium RBG_13_66_14]
MSEEIVTLAHGGGGIASRRLLREHLLPRLDSEALRPLGDSALVDVPPGGIALTTDSYVIQPWRFPGGDIGKLAVCGTVNDLAVMGARPLYLTLGLILEEGLPLADLDAVIASVAETAREAGIEVVAGDTKVVGRGDADCLYLNTSGIGVFDYAHVRLPGPRAGDRLLVTGALGDHGLAVMAARERLPLKSELSSDCAPLSGLVEAMRGAGRVTWMRDCTRGGLASAANELAEDFHLGVHLFEDELVVHDAAAAVAELLGLDILHVANEGVILTAVAEEDAGRVLAAARRHPYGGEASLVGALTEAHPRRVVLETAVGGERIVDMLTGEQLPRIC